MCATGEDKQFGVVASMLAPVQTAPFYAVPVYGSRTSRCATAST